MHLIWKLLLSAAYPKNLHPKAILGKEKKNRKAGSSSTAVTTKGAEARGGGRAVCLRC
jgi:hypothetical protein